MALVVLVIMATHGLFHDLEQYDLKLVTLKKLNRL